MTPTEGLVLTVQTTCRPSDGASWEFTQSQLWMPSAGTWNFCRRIGVWNIVLVVAS